MGREVKMQGFGCNIIISYKSTALGVFAEMGLEEVRSVRPENCQVQVLSGQSPQTSPSKNDSSGGDRDSEPGHCSGPLISLFSGWDHRCVGLLISVQAGCLNRNIT